jgi:hypothetical protein
MEQAMDYNEIKQRYPDEWILLGNPVWEETATEPLSGIVLYHSKNKKEVCYLGEPLTANYDKIALLFNRVTPRAVKHVLLGPFITFKQ